MKKNKSLIYLRTFNIGGAERSNLRMMKRLAADGWEVELVLHSSGGTLENQIPPGIKVNHLDRGLFQPSASDSEFKLKTKDWLRRAVQKLSIYIYKTKKYDLAINGLSADAYFVAEYVRADVKLAWIRIDIDFLRRANLSVYKLTKYAADIDSYPCVSRSAYQSLVEKVPALLDKAFVLYNFYDRDEMLRQSKENPAPYYGYKPGVFKVVTVCRIHDRQKGVFRMLDVYKRLRDDGVDFYWFVIGGGPDFEELSARTSELGLDEGFILLGPVSNPFPYYRHADLCAVFSYYEGLCGTVSEAKFMGKAVIATEFAGIHEQIQHLSNGYIVANNEDAIYAGMKTLLSDQELVAGMTNDVLPMALADENVKAERLYKTIDALRAKKSQ